jgi:prevent-host-death family protein
MSEVGTYEAKTHFARIIERVSRGERITILRHGVPVAVIVPPGARPDDVDDAIGEIRAMRCGKRRGGPSLAEMLAEGRR